mmetsp:Transcript_20392/g.44313  ORF Transcript_20392/g.44313 Transcript_20392/m.44313 type:complete len:84 (-) Transcript_20392:262-513(-)
MTSLCLKGGRQILLHENFNAALKLLAKAFSLHKLCASNTRSTALCAALAMQRDGDELSCSSGDVDHVFVNPKLLFRLTAMPCS